MVDANCTCPICHEQILDDPRETVLSHLEYIKNAVKDDDQLLEALFSLFNLGWKSGYTTSTSLRIEEDVQTLKFITNNWNA